MIKLFLDYLNASKDYIKKNEKIIKTGLLLLITVIAGIYINLFTNSDNLKDFFGINLNMVGELYFMLAFSLIAMLCLLRALVSILIIGIIGLVSSFGLYLTSRGYLKLVNKLDLKENLLSQLILMLFNFCLAMYLLWGTPNTTIGNPIFLIKYLTVFVLLWIGLTSFKLAVEEMENKKSKPLVKKKESSKIEEKEGEGKNNNMGFWGWILIICSVALVIFLIINKSYYQALSFGTIMTLIIVLMWATGISLKEEDYKKTEKKVELNKLRLSKYETLSVALISIGIGFALSGINSGDYYNINTVSGLGMVIIGVLIEKFHVETRYKVLEDYYEKHEKEKIKH
jgi:hypothetical protein